MWGTKFRCHYNGDPDEHNHHWMSMLFDKGLYIQNKYLFTYCSWKVTSFWVFLGHLYVLYTSGCEFSQNFSKTLHATLRPVYNKQYPNNPIITGDYTFLWTISLLHLFYSLSSIFLSLMAGSSPPLSSFLLISNEMMKKSAGTADLLLRSQALLNWQSVCGKENMIPP